MKSTISAASRMNCLELSFQIAGTVNTQPISFTLISVTLLQKAVLHILKHYLTGFVYTRQLYIFESYRQYNPPIYL